MNRESVGAETTKKPAEQESFGVPQEQANQSLEDLCNQMMSEAQSEVDQLKRECTDDLAKVEVRAGRDGLVIDPEDRAALEVLGGEVDLAHAELLTEIGTEEMYPPDPEEHEIGLPIISEFSIPDPEEDEAESLIPDPEEDVIEGGAEKKETEGGYLGLAQGEIVQAGELVYLEEQASQFQLAIDSLAVPRGVDIATNFENDYAIPATIQAETLQGTVVRNSAIRRDESQELKKEKPFDSVARIMDDKKALCIHFMTGLSNELNGTTGKGAISAMSLNSVDRKKVERIAISQMKTLAGLNPSVSTSLFADSHKFSGSWYRGQSQPIGAIIREGKCVGISSQDAGTSSRSVKRRGGADILTADRLSEVLSPEDTHFTRSGYNEAVISEPRIGALFMPTGGSVSREILASLQNENTTYGYPIFLESGGDFFSLSREHMGALLIGDEESINVTSFLREKFKISRDEIRKHLEALDSQDLQAKEKSRFDGYIENYDLKPHFSWSGELSATIDTQLAFHLAQEKQKIVGYQNNLALESEQEGALTRRLTEYFRQNPGKRKSYEVRKKIYVDGELYEGDEGMFEEYKKDLPPDAKVEVRTTKILEYEDEIVDPLAMTESVRGIGEVSNVQKKRNIRLFVFQYPDGSVFYRASENMHLRVNRVSVGTGEIIHSDDAVHYLSSEELEKSANGEVKREGSFKEDLQKNYRPSVTRYQEGDSFIDTPDSMQKKIASGMFDAEQLKQVALHAKTLADMYRESGNEELSREWQGIASAISPDIHERQAFVRSKLNQNGTLRLDTADAAEL